MPAPSIDPACCAQYFHLNSGAWHYISFWGVMFFELTGPIRYDPSQRIDKREAFRATALRIEAGTAPEKAGLPNIGIPEGVPSVAVDATGFHATKASQ